MGSLSAKDSGKEGMQWTNTEDVIVQLGITGKVGKSNRVGHLSICFDNELNKIRKRHV